MRRQTWTEKRPPQKFKKKEFGRTEGSVPKWSGRLYYAEFWRESLSVLLLLLLSLGLPLLQIDDE
jgi:hypothetical protein